MTLRGLRIALVGPLPPPEGGMANQTRQLAELLRSEGAQVRLVRVNAPYRPSWVRNLRGMREPFRLVPYLVDLWRACRCVDVVHIMANSGWSWHLVAAPAVWIARLQGVPAVVNYRGGAAAGFLARSGSRVHSTVRRAGALVVPSAFLQQVFARLGMRSEIVPNIINTARFRPSDAATRQPHLVVVRSLETIYDIGTALKAFALIRKNVPAARLTVAGSGPEEARLKSLADELGISAAVNFCGRLGHDHMAELYRLAAVVMNPSRVDNMPNSVLEAMASGVPLVTTDAGGIPLIVRHGVTGLIVPMGDAHGMAAAVERILGDAGLAGRLREAALVEVQQYTWPRVRQQWAAVYASVLSGTEGETRPA